MNLVVDTWNKKSYNIDVLIIICLQKEKKIDMGKRYIVRHCRSDDFTKKWYEALLLGADSNPRLSLLTIMENSCNLQIC